jgi:inner membrane protein
VPSVFSHAIVGSTLVACGLSRPRASVVAMGAALAVVPDLDVVGLAFGWGLDHPLGHRGLSHSLVAAAGVAALATAALKAQAGESRWRVWLVLALAAASHGVLDAFTNGGRGVAFFAPVLDTRWHFALRPIEVSPIGVWSFVSRRGAEVLANEVVWLWAPSLAALAATWAVRRSRSQPAPPTDPRATDPRTPAARAPDR